MIPRTATLAFASSLAALLVLSAPVLAANVHIHIQGFAFNPNQPTVLKGDVVTWDNHDGAPHTTTDNACPRAGGPGPCEWDSLTMGTGATFTHTFNKADIFDYRCTIHGFAGRLFVDDPNALPDLRITNLKVVDQAVNKKQIEFTVENAGQDWALGSRTRVGYVYQGNFNQLGDFAVGELRVGRTSAFTVSWFSTGKIGDFVIEARADSNGQIAESNEANNVATATASWITPPGTVPGVDLFDPV